MINLLPADAKKQLRAARNNAVLRRYYVLVLLSACLLGAIFALGFKVTLDQEASYQAIKQQSEAESAKYSEVRKSAEDFNKNLEAAKTILASDVRFSQLITDIAGVIPSGVILSNLSLNSQSSANAPLTINGRAKTYDDAVKLKNSLEESPIFENVSLLSASAGSGSADSEYPVGVSISARFSKAGGTSK